MIATKDLMIEQMVDERETLREQHHKLFIMGETIKVLCGELSEKIERLTELIE